MWPPNMESIKTRAHWRKRHAAACIPDLGLRYVGPAAVGLGAGRRKMGRKLDGFRARPIPDRQPLGPAGPEIRLSRARDRRSGSDLPPNRAARPLGPTDPAAADQC